MSRMNDEEFRQMYAASERNKKEIADRLKKQAEQAQIRSRILRESAKKHENLAVEHEAAAERHMKIAEEERNAAKTYVQDAEKEETLEMVFRLDPETFTKAISPVIKRSIKKNVAHGRFTFEFLKEDVKLPMKTLNWTDTVVIRFQRDGECVERGYLTYNPDWRKFCAEGKPATYYLQKSYQFELGNITQSKDILEGLDYQHITEF